MKKKIIISSLFLILISFILFAIFSLTINRDTSLVKTNLKEVSKIVITEKQGRTVVIQDENTINNVINYFKSVKMTKKFWWTGTPDTWDYRIGIYGLFDNSSSILKEGIFLRNDLKVYKNNFIYDLDNFDYDYLLKLLSQS